MQPLMANTSGSITAGTDTIRYGDGPANSTASMNDSLPQESHHGVQSEWHGLSSTLWVYFAPFIFFIGIIGNILILIIINRKKFRGTSTSVYLCCMAVADLLVLIVGMIPEWLSAAHDIVFKEISPVTCKIEKIVSYTVGDVAVWILMAFTIDRCVAVCFPFAKAGVSSSKRAKVVCAVLVAIAITKNFHVLWTRGETWEPNDEGVLEFVKNCGRPEPYTNFEKYIRPWIVFTLISLIPFIVILVCNTMIIRALIHSKKQHRTQNIQANQDRHYWQLSLMCLSASFAFLLCITPSIVLLIGKPYWAYDSESYIIAKAVNNQLMYVNHSVNFFLYCITGARFRRDLYLLFCSWRIDPSGGISDSDTRSQVLQNRCHSNATTPIMPIKRDQKNGFLKLENPSTKNTSCVWGLKEQARIQDILIWSLGPL